MFEFNTLVILFKQHVNVPSIQQNWALLTLWVYFYNSSQLLYFRYFCRYNVNVSYRLYFANQREIKCGEYLG